MDSKDIVELYRRIRRLRYFMALVPYEPDWVYWLDLILAHRN